MTGKRWIEERQEYDVALNLGLPHPNVSVCVRVAAQALARGKKQAFLGALENSGSDRTRFVTAAPCAVRIAIQYAHLKTRPQRNDICSALIKIDKEYDVRNNLFKLDMLSLQPKRQRGVGLPAV